MFLNSFSSPFWVVHFGLDSSCRGSAFVNVAVYFYFYEPESRWIGIGGHSEEPDIVWRLDAINC